MKYYKRGKYTNKLLVRSPNMFFFFVSFCWCWRSFGWICRSSTGCARWSSWLKWLNLSKRGSKAAYWLDCGRRGRHNIWCICIIYIYRGSRSIKTTCRATVSFHSSPTTHSVSTVMSQKRRSVLECCGLWACWCCRWRCCGGRRGGCGRASCSSRGCGVH